MANAPRPRTPRIPYGRTDFRAIRLDGCLYVDKTPFVRQLEAHNYVLFIRPRRFGKTGWLSLLECYYARHRQSEVRHRVNAWAHKLRGRSALALQSGHTGAAGLPTPPCAA